MWVRLHYLAFGLEPLRERQEHVGCPEVGGYGIGIEVLLRRVAEVDSLAVSPVYEVIGDARPDGSHVVVGPNAVIRHVVSTFGVPKRQILRIEGAPRQHGTVSNLPPMDAVRRRERLGRLPPESLVLLVRRCRRVGVLERCEIVGHIASPDHVVFRRSCKLDDAKLRPCPDDAVLALGITGALGHHG